ncbi:MAG: hypothetical protein WAM92_16285 [Mycobacterium sp.]
MCSYRDPAMDGAVGDDGSRGVDFRARLRAGATEPDWTGEAFSQLVAAGLTALR